MFDLLERLNVRAEGVTSTPPHTLLLYLELLVIRTPFEIKLGLILLLSDNRYHMTGFILMGEYERVLVVLPYPRAPFGQILSFKHHCKEAPYPHV